MTRSVLALLCLCAVAATQQLRWNPIPDLGDNYGGTLVWDPVRSVTLAFGGGLVSSSGGEHDQTWEYDGRRWLRLRPRVSPPARHGHAMAYDPVSKRMLLFGGATGYATNLGDTWAWDGQTWTQLQPKSAPAARCYHAMATDLQRGRILLFGGGLFNAGRTAGAYDDTWEWNGSNWQQLTPVTIPTGGRILHELAWHAPTGSIYMFGGSTGFTIFAHQLWQWNGADWRRLPDMPLIGATAALKEPNQNDLWVLGKVSSTPEWWRFDGQTWTKLATPDPGCLMYSFDDARQRVIGFAGVTSVPGPTCGYPRTWEWDGQQWRLTHEWGARTGIAGWVYQPDKDRILALGWQCGSLKRPLVFTLVDDQLVLLSSSSSGQVGGRVLTYLDHARKVFQYGFTANSVDVFETWTWDDTAGFVQWKGPQPDRTLGCGAYDRARRKVVFLGYNAKTWEWDETSGWVEVRTQHAPPAGTTGHNLAYDPVRRRMVLYDARDAANAWTWEYDGTDWRELKPKTMPAWRMSGTLVYADILGGVALIGGNRGIAGPWMTDLWRWDGSDWTQITSAVGTYEVLDYSLDAISDSGRHRLLVLAPPANLNGYVTRWELVSESLRLSEVLPLGGQPFTAEVELRQEAGRPFLLAFALTHWPGIPVRDLGDLGLERLPLAPGPIFFASLQVGLVAALDGSGKARFPLMLPADPALTGLRLHFAGAAFGPGGGISAVTNRAWLDLR